jgi:aspartate/methionine/tyrosine aminotransferase
MNCKQLADFLLNEAGVATLAGSDFGKYGEGYIRLSYANSLENLQKGLDRIKTAVAKIAA